MSSSFVSTQLTAGSESILTNPVWQPPTDILQMLGFIIPEVLPACMIRFASSSIENSIPPLRTRHTKIYWDDSTWEATVKDGNTFEAFRYHEIQDSKEACHTAQSEVLELEITEDRVKGTWRRENRTEGPKVCGDTPTGQKDEVTLSGMRSQSL